MMPNLFVPSTRWFFGPFDPLPNPWHSHPSSLSYDVSHMCKNFGCLRSWRYCNSCPEVFSMTGSARIWRNWAGYCRLAAWDGVMTLAMAVVCDRVRQAIGLRSVALYTIGVGGSTVCGTLDLVRRATGSYCSLVAACEPHADRKSVVVHMLLM